MNHNLLVKSLLAAALATVSIGSFAAPIPSHHANYHHKPPAKAVRVVHHHQHAQHQNYRQPVKTHTAYQRWQPGDYLPVAYRAPQYVVNNWKTYRLSAPARGQQWLRINGRFVQVSAHDHRITRIL